MVEPNIIKTKYYTLVSADTGHGKTLWCKKKVARLLRTTQDRIIVIDVTGEYADFVLDHDRIVPRRIPMVMHQYKLSGGWPVDAHIIEVDMPINRQPQLIVYDVSRTMGTWHRGVLAISDALLGYMTGRENTTTWLFLNLDPYFYEKQDDETSWKVLEHFVKQQGQTVKPVFTSQKFSADTINQRLHIEEAATIGQLPNSILTVEVFGDWIDFTAILDSMMLDGDTVFKKLILVQNDYTYRELDYEYGRAIVSDSVGLEEGRTTIGKVQKRKIIYRKSQDGSITKEVIDTTNITNDVHKWLADRGYSKVG